MCAATVLDSANAASERGKTLLRGAGGKVGLTGGLGNSRGMGSVLSSLPSGSETITSAAAKETVGGSTRLINRVKTKRRQTTMSTRVTKVIPRSNHAVNPLSTKKSTTSGGRISVSFSKTAVATGRPCTMVTSRGSVKPNTVAKKSTVRALNGEGEEDGVKSLDINGTDGLESRLSAVGSLNVPKRRK